MTTEDSVSLFLCFLPHHVFWNPFPLHSAPERVSRPRAGWQAQKEETGKRHSLRLGNCRTATVTFWGHFSALWGALCGMCGGALVQS